MNKTTLALTAIVTIISAPTMAIDEASSSELVAELNQGKVVQKIIPLDKVEKNAYIYKRNRHLNSHRDSSYPDYFYLWHGEDQGGYPFMNLSTLMSNNATLNKPKALFLALDDKNGLWEDAILDSNLISAIANGYKKATNVKREISVGYDTGVSQAYSFACNKKLGYIVLAAGGLSSGETCMPTGTQVLYTYNTGDKKYPYDHKNAFSSGKDGWSTLTNRLDAKASISKLKQLMKCENYVSTEALRSQVHSFNCKNENQLTIVATSSPLHQWNGYSNVNQGAYNQEGSPVTPKVTHWINTEFGIK